MSKFHSEDNSGGYEMSGWLPFPVYCNGHRIASFNTPLQREQFMNEREAAYPKNRYSTVPDPQ